ncbi:hypothetical protein [Kocuria rosea]|uniref:hypothetical protein n=1 Tax=Kocuria rosea TaxID=1275 RepID=UPI00204091CF|nr:hypothetical protein [Kocuria rosea]MCM3687482.1 hypothetical protein [Kocuria rosea]
MTRWGFGVLAVAMLAAAVVLGQTALITVALLVALAGISGDLRRTRAIADRS